MAVRKEGWERALFDYIKAARKRPFSWGEFDCCLFAADVIEILTGIDPAVDFRGRYETAAGALRVMKKEGGDIDGLAEKIFPALDIWPLPSPRLARRGDILRLVIPGTLPAFGGMGAVCLGASVAVLTDDGMMSVPLTLAAREFAAKAWRV